MKCCLCKRCSLEKGVMVIFDKPAQNTTTDVWPVLCKECAVRLACYLRWQYKVLNSASRGRQSSRQNIATLVSITLRGYDNANKEVQD